MTESAQLTFCELTGASSTFFSESQSTRGAHALNLNFLSSTTSATAQIYDSMVPLKYSSAGSSNFSADFALHTTVKLSPNVKQFVSIAIKSLYAMVVITNNSTTAASVFTSDAVIHLSTTYNPIALNTEVISEDKHVLLTRSTKDHEVDATLGNIEGTSMLSMSAQGSLSSSESLLRGGGLFAEAHSLGLFADDAARAVSVRSTNNNDKASSFGASAVKITGILSTGAEHSETIQLNGTSPVVTASQYKAVNSAEVVEVGANNNAVSNLGQLLFHVTDSNGADTALNFVEMGDGVSHNPIFHVPANKTAIIKQIAVNSYCEDEGEIFVNRYQKSASGKWYRHTVKRFHIHANQHLQNRLNFTAQAGDKITITRKSTTALTTPTNHVTIQLFGVLA